MAHPRNSGTGETNLPDSLGNLESGHDSLRTSAMKSYAVSKLLCVKENESIILSVKLVILQMTA